MRAWWTYWGAVTVGAVIWIGALALGGRDGLKSMLANPVGLAVLVLPIVIAGVDLVLFRRSHEQVCRLEVERHRWMRMLAGNGYSADTFAQTGFALIAVAIVIVIAQLAGGGS